MYTARQRVIQLAGAANADPRSVEKWMRDPSSVRASVASRIEKAAADLTANEPTAEENMALQLAAASKMIAICAQNLADATSDMIARRRSQP